MLHMMQFGAPAISVRICMLSLCTIESVVWASSSVRDGKPRVVFISNGPLSVVPVDVSTGLFSLESEGMAQLNILDLKLTVSSDQHQNVTSLKFCNMTLTHKLQCNIPRSEHVQSYWVEQLFISLLNSELDFVQLLFEPSAFSASMPSINLSHLTSYLKSHYPEPSPEEGEATHPLKSALPPHQTRPPRSYCNHIIYHSTPYGVCRFEVFVESIDERDELHRRYLSIISKRSTSSNVRGGLWASVGLGSTRGGQMHVLDPRAP